MRTENAVKIVALSFVQDVKLTIKYTVKITRLMAIYNAHNSIIREVTFVVVKFLDIFK